MSGVDGDLYEVAANADRLIKNGATIWQKFTCENCGSRQTMPDANVFYKLGKCQECEYVTDLVLRGCGFTVMWTSERDNKADVVKMISESIANTPKGGYK